MLAPLPSPVVHLELHTGDLPCARAFVSKLLHWREEHVDTPSGSYTALDFGSSVGGGIVNCGLQPAMWLPYVEVESVHERAAEALQMGATLLLSPCEGPAGWRSVISTPQAGQIALWQPKEWHDDRRA
jgi:predicted enzyme related to lactoylglutathione lyase